MEEKVIIKELMYRNTKCYYIENGTNSMLVDTDWAGTMPGFFSLIKDLELNLDDIKYLLITHYHPSHMGMAASFMEYGIKLIIVDVQMGYIHKLDAIFDRERNRSFRPIDEKEAQEITCEESRAFLKKIGFDGEIVHTPGHSEDSISLILDDGVAIVGDLEPFSKVNDASGEAVKKSWELLISKGVKKAYYGHSQEEMICDDQAQGLQMVINDI